MLLQTQRVRDVVGSGVLAALLLSSAGLFAWERSQARFVDGECDAGSVAQLVMEHRAALLNCVEREAMRTHQPVLTTLQVDVTVQPEGHASRMIIPNTELIPELAQCVGDEMLRWNFGAAHSLRVITVPLPLRSR